MVPKDMQKEIWNGSEISILPTTINGRFKKLRVVQSNNTLLLNKRTIDPAPLRRLS